MVFPHGLIHEIGNNFVVCVCLGGGGGGGGGGVILASMGSMINHRGI